MEQPLYSSNVGVGGAPPGAWSVSTQRQRPEGTCHNEAQGVLFQTWAEPLWWCGNRIGGVIALRALPGQLRLLCPRLSSSAAGGSGRGGMNTGQERVRAWLFWPPAWQISSLTVPRGGRCWRQRSARSSLCLMEYHVRKMNTKPTNFKLAAKPKYTKRKEVTSYSQHEPCTPQSCCHSMHVVSITAPK